MVTKLLVPYNVFGVPWLVGALLDFSRWTLLDAVT
jgi:hypothetical protein